MCPKSKLPSLAFFSFVVLVCHHDPLESSKFFIHWAVGHEPTPAELPNDRVPNVHTTGWFHCWDQQRFGVNFASHWIQTQKTVTLASDPQLWSLFLVSYLLSFRYDFELPRNLVWVSSSFQFGFVIQSLSTQILLFPLVAVFGVPLSRPSCEWSSHDW